LASVKLPLPEAEVFTGGFSSAPLSLTLAVLPPDHRSLTVAQAASATSAITAIAFLTSIIESSSL